MDGLIILAAIAWIILSAVSRKKQKEQQEARKKAAQGQFAPGSVPGSVPAAPPQARPVQRPAPARPAPTPAKPRMPAAAFDAAEGDSAPAQAQARSEQSRRPTAPPESRMQQNMQSTLRGTPMQHTLEVSGVSGHAHEETSITGVQAEPCPPEKSGKKAAPEAKQPLPAAPQPSNPGGFVWNQNAVLQGMVMAEILGKPRCLRQGRR